MAGAHAIAQLDEHHGVAVAHDQVELAMTRVVVARQRLEAGAFQFAAGALFEGIAGGAHQWPAGGKPVELVAGGTPVDVAGIGVLPLSSTGGAAEGTSSSCRLPVSGRATPSWKRAQISTRRMRPIWSAASWPL